MSQCLLQSTTLLCLLSCIIQPVPLGAECVSGSVGVWLQAKANPLQKHYPSRWQNSILSMLWRSLRLVQYNVQLLCLPCDTKVFGDSSLSYWESAFKLIYLRRNWKLFSFWCFCAEEEMKIILQCDCFGSNDLTTILFSLESVQSQGIWCWKDKSWKNSTFM